MSFQVIFYFAASAMIVMQTTINSVSGQCTTERCGHDDLSMNIITEIQQQIDQALGPLSTQIQNIHDLLTSQYGSLMTSLQAVDRRLEEHDIYIKQGQHFHELHLNASFQEMKSQFDAVNASLQTVDRNLENFQMDTKNQTDKSWKLVNDIWDAVVSPVRDCSDLKARGHTANGVYEVCAGHQPNRVCANAYCDMESTNGTSLVFQRRKDGSVNFNRAWAEYKEGFGNADGEFWLGNEMLYLLTSKRNYKLRVDLEDWEGAKRYAEYSTFSISSSADNYRLAAGGYSGNTGDGMSYNSGRQFTTIDVDNDAKDRINCALQQGGGWWHRHCSWVNLNGIYYSHRYDTAESEKGIIWYQWKNSFTYSFKTTEMKLIPVV